MDYTEEKLAQYPEQDEQQLLVEFAAQVLARHQYEANGHAGVSWTEWLGSTDGLESRLVPYREQTAQLAALGMLVWPARTEGPRVRWIIERPGRDSAKDVAPELDWIDTFGMDAAAALEMFRACRTLGRPVRLSWQFFGKERP